MQQNAFELYRYGVLAPTIKANNVYSEAYELRTLVVDLRYDSMDLCILNALKQGLSTSAAASQCKSGVRQFPDRKDVSGERCVRSASGRGVPQPVQSGNWDGDPV